MPFPPSEREIYDINPLNEVICQIRYPAILRVSAATPFEFQDTIRRVYPLYEEKTVLPSSLPPPLQESLSGLMAAFPFPTPPELREHQFFTEDRIRSISLAQEFMSVTDTNYTQWEDFRAAIELAEDTLQNTYNPTFYQRVGLRYVDILVRETFGMPEIPWAQLLNPSFIGMLGDQDLDDDIQELTTETLLTIPDVQEGYVHIKHGLATAQASNEQVYEKVYVIDADFYTSRRSNSNGAFHVLDIFNRWGGYLFRWATTPKLRDALGRKQP
jgi:uncharacterized protein (TIGR04255 family)